jgi:hypothetical protein
MKLSEVLLGSWWTYHDGVEPWFDVPYHAFNLFEGSAWVVLAGLVLRRHLRSRRSRLEWAYAAAFFTFGMTDFWEAYAIGPALVGLKLVNLVLLIRLRSAVIRRFHPGSRWY